MPEPTTPERLTDLDAEEMHDLAHADPAGYGEAVDRDARRMVQEAAARAVAKRGGGRHG